MPGCAADRCRRTAVAGQAPQGFREPDAVGLVVMASVPSFPVIQ